MIDKFIVLSVVKMLQIMQEPVPDHWFDFLHSLSLKI